MEIEFSLSTNVVSIKKNKPKIKLPEMLQSDGFDRLF